MFTVEEFKDILVWLVLYFMIFALSWVPIWRNSEVLQRQRHYPSNPVRKKPSKGSYSSSSVSTIIYGWQTRKRLQKAKKQYTAWALMHPRLFYEGTYWMFIYVLTAISSYLAIDKGDESDSSSSSSLLEAAALLTLVHAFVFGTWTIFPFYWDMPFWGCLHLTFSLIVSGILSWLYATLNITSLWFILPLLITQLYMVLGNWLAWIFAGRGNNRTTRIRNPFKAYFNYGLHPISFTIRDFV